MNEADNFILVGGSFIKQGNLHTGLILGSCKVRSPHHLSESLSLQSGFNWVQSCLRLDGLNSKLLSPVCILENGSGCGISGWNIYSFKGQRRGRGASDYPDPVHRSIAGHDLSITSLTKSKEYVKRHRREAISKS